MATPSHSPAQERGHVYLQLLAATSLERHGGGGGDRSPRRAQPNLQLPSAKGGDSFSWQDHNRMSGIPDLGDTVTSCCSASDAPDTRERQRSGSYGGADICRVESIEGSAGKSISPEDGPHTPPPAAQRRVANSMCLTARVAQERGGLQAAQGAASSPDLASFLGSPPRLGGGAAAALGGAATAPKRRLDLSRTGSGSKASSPVSPTPGDVSAWSRAQLEAEVRELRARLAKYEPAAGGLSFSGSFRKTDIFGTHTIRGDNGGGRGTPPPPLNDPRDLPAGKQSPPKRSPAGSILVMSNAATNMADRIDNRIKRTLDKQLRPRSGTSPVDRGGGGGDGGSSSSILEKSLNALYPRDPSPIREHERVATAGGDGGGAGGGARRNPSMRSLTPSDCGMSRLGSAERRGRQWSDVDGKTRSLSAGPSGELEYELEVEGGLGRCNSSIGSKTRQGSALVDKKGGRSAARAAIVQGLRRLKPPKDEEKDKDNRGKLGGTKGSTFLAGLPSPRNRPQVFSPTRNADEEKKLAWTREEDNTVRRLQTKRDAEGLSPEEDEQLKTLQLRESQFLQIGIDNLNELFVFTVAVHKCNINEKNGKAFTEIKLRAMNSDTGKVTKNTQEVDPQKYTSRTVPADTDDPTAYSWGEGAKDLTKMCLSGTAAVVLRVSIFTVGKLKNKEKACTLDIIARDVLRKMKPGQSVTTLYEATSGKGQVFMTIKLL